MNKERKNELSRVPQSLSYDYTALERAFDSRGDKAGKLIKDILIFLSNYKMKNLFGENEFTIQDFCTQMGYTRTHLQKKLSEEKIEEIFGQNIPILESPNSQGVHIHKIETVFEAALWRAMKENVTFTRSKDGRSYYQAVQLIQSISIDYNKDTKKSTKRVYTVKLGHNVVDFLFTQYFLIEMQDYRKLPLGEGYRQFYIYLSRIISIIKYNIKQQKPPYYLISVDDLASIFGLNIERNDLRKTKVRKYLNTIQELVVIAKFEWEFIKNGEKYAYHVKFTIDDKTLDYFDERNKALFFRSLFSQCSDHYYRTYTNLRTRELDRIFEEQPQERSKFFEWFSSEENIPDKERLFIATYRKIFGGMPTMDTLKEYFKDISNQRIVDILKELQTKNPQYSKE